MVERPVVPTKPGNSGRGKGPWFKVNAARGEQIAEPPSRWLSALSRDVLEADQLQLFSQESLLALCGWAIFAELFRKLQDGIEKSGVVVRLGPNVESLSQLDVECLAHRLTEEGDASLRLFAVHGSASNRVFELLGHGLLNRIDTHGRGGPGLCFSFGTQDVLDHLALQ